MTLRVIFAIVIILRHHQHHYPEMEKGSERRKHCALTVVRRSQKFSPRGRPPTRRRGTAKI